jgi:hypothetical protein
MPWVEANGWMIRLAQAQNPGKTVWVDCAPPEDAGISGCRLAVADCAAFGARWVVSPGKQFPGEPDWKRVVSALEFFEKRVDWRSYEPVAALGVLSDFTGPNEFMGSEALNLIARRQLCYKVLLPSAAKSLAGLAGVIYVDEKPPAGAMAEILAAWVRGGGLLLAPPGTKLGEPSGELYDGYKIYKLGKGRVAVVNDPWSDPYLVAQDAHLLLTRKHDLLRLFNFGAMNSHYVRSRDGRKGVVHLMNYSRREAAHQITLAVAAQYRTGRFHTFDGVTPLNPSPAAKGVEFALPPFDVYAAIEMEM